MVKIKREIWLCPAPEGAVETSRILEACVCGME